MSAAGPHRRAKLVPVSVSHTSGGDADGARASGESPPACEPARGGLGGNSGPLVLPACGWSWGALCRLPSGASWGGLEWAVWRGSRW